MRQTMSFSPEAVKRIVYAAADFLIANDEATVTEGIRYGITEEVLLYGDPFDNRAPIGFLSLKDALEKAKEQR